LLKESEHDLCDCLAFSSSEKNDRESKRYFLRIYLMLLFLI